MPVNTLSDDTLRAALRPYRVDPETFEAAVRVRLKAAEKEREDEPLAGLTPLQRSAAAFLPLQVLAGSKMAANTVKLGPAAGASKLFGYVAFPAISVFVLLGATVFSVAKIRGIRQKTGAGLNDQRAMNEGLLEWWRYHRCGAFLVFGATMAMSFVGATWLLYLFYIISFGLLLYVLASLAKLGLGNRRVIAPSCMMGLMFLTQSAAFPGIGNQDIHFVDQILLIPVFWAGALVLLVLLLLSGPSLSEMGGRRSPTALLWVTCALFAVVVVPMSVEFLNPILRPASPSRIKSYVESFKEAPYESVSWRKWEIVASWAIESKRDPDLSSARRLLAAEIAGEQDSFILGTAFRLGLVRIDQLGQLREYKDDRRSLLNSPYRKNKAQPFSGVSQIDWVIRDSALRNDLSPEERDYLQKRLRDTMDNQSNASANVLETALRVTQLLEVIERPIDRDQYRDRVHDWLRKFHCKQEGRFQLAGGFTQYLQHPVGSLETTSYAIELMAIYGIPAGLDLNWERSFLRPLYLRYSYDEVWIAAVTLDRLNHLPGVRRPTWFEYLYYERSLAAAAVLVGLCIYATLSSPKPKPFKPAPR